MKPSADSDANMCTSRSEKVTLTGRPVVPLDDATSAGPPIASGRVTSIAVHPANPDIVYLGAANGGVWKTVDAGRNWMPLTDDQDSLAIGSYLVTKLEN